MYESDPDNPDPADIARATDYIVAYACKGVETLQQEKRQMVSLVLQSAEMYGDKADVQRIARQLLNKTIGEKMISKQEAMVLAGQLKLIDCSELFTTVSISGYYKLQGGHSNSTMLQTYARRCQSLSHLTLHQYFHYTRNKVQEPSGNNCKYVPHYVGASSFPVYPPTPAYSKSIILIHTPWSKTFDDTQDFPKIFESLTTTKKLPSFVLIPFLRVRERVLYRVNMKEPTNVCHDPITPFLSESVPEDLKEIVKLANLLPSSLANTDPNEHENLDFGLNFDWSKQWYESCNPEEAANFLKVEIEEYEKLEDQDLRIPTKTDGTPYTLKDLTPAQQDIMSYILYTLHAWVNASKQSNTFSPLYLTIRGQGGSGKSTLLKTLITVLRKMFQRNDVCQVCAPTGSAAHEVGGRTIHTLFGITLRNVPDTMGPTLVRRLQKQFANIVALVIDERSMLSSELFAIVEHYARQTFHRGQNPNKVWGKLPILLLVGDDYQLPSIGMGAFDALTPPHEKNRTLTKTNEKLLQRVATGEHLFIQCAKEVMHLPKIERVDPDQVLLHQLLHGVRAEDEDSNLTDYQIDVLSKKLHLMSPHFTPSERTLICKDALFLFANCAPRDTFNKTMLQSINCPNNPTAKIRAHTYKNGVLVSNNSHYNENVPPFTTFSRGARVAISGCNIMPTWGLFNGSIGTVLDVVFREGESPNTGNHPIYVLVDFSLYSGPPFLLSTRRAVPITPVTVLCDRNCCCKRTFIPLTLSFGKTAHTFQGQQAGPTDPGRPPNSVQRIICDPGTRTFEGQNVGLLYTILSRTTTLGAVSKDTPYHLRFKNSAIYFFTSNMNRDRVKNITKQANGSDYAKVIKRRRWTNYLKNRTITSNIPSSRRKDLFEWASKTTYSKSTLQKIINLHSKS